MDFGAYLASSSSDDSDNEGAELVERGSEAAANDKEKMQKYKVHMYKSLVWSSLCEFVVACRTSSKRIGRRTVKVVLKKTWEPGDDVMMTSPSFLMYAQIEQA